MGDATDVSTLTPPVPPPSSASPARPPFQATSEETLIDRAVTEYLEEISTMPDVGLSEIRDDLLSRISGVFAVEATARKGAEIPAPILVKPKALDELTVVRILLARRNIAAVSLSNGTGANDDMTVLAMYQDSGEHRGLYLTGDSALIRLASEVRPSLTATAIESLLKRLKAHAPVLDRTIAAHLIPVNNGVFDHRTKTLLPFSPKWVFLAKSPVNYVAGAVSPKLTHPVDGTVWEVEEWMETLSDDEGVAELLWQVVSAAVRPGVRWNKAVFFHSSRGNNGKGTLCSLMRNLLGPQGCASIPIADFGKPFALSELAHARAIIVDENSVGAFSRDLGDFKAVVTGDAFTLDRKYRAPVSISFSGIVVQCVNDFPKSRDKSASYTRRQLFVPFKKWFGGGIERGYIKSDYLTRPEVLEYVLARVLEMDHEEFDNPDACQALLDQFQRENNPVRDFWMEMESEFTWDLLPTAFLYDLFISWFRKNHPSGIPVNRNEFATQLVEVLSGDGRWNYRDPQKKHRPGSKMAVSEPLIAEYDLKDWRNSAYSGKDPQKVGLFDRLRSNYIGVARVPLVPAVPAAVSDDDEPGCEPTEEESP